MSITPGASHFVQDPMMTIPITLDSQSIGDRNYWNQNESVKKERARDRL